MNVWIDLENTPHAMIFEPIIERLESLGHQIYLTAKDTGHTLGLLDRFGLSYDVVGGGERRGTVSKGISAFDRAIRLAWRMKDCGIDVGISHGSRSHILASTLARIPCITAYDYEHSSKLFVHSLPDRILLPACLQDSDRIRTIPSEKVSYYQGYKEEIYLSTFEPRSSMELDVTDPQSIVVLVRPPSGFVHYHTTESDLLFTSVMKMILSRSRTKAILIPRSADQERELRATYRSFGDRVVIPDGAVDGLNTIWHCDLVISAGGTMNREAALLGVPTYSILTATLGAADRSLIQEGRLTHIVTREDVASIRFEKRPPGRLPDSSSSVLEFFVNQIVSWGGTS
ncbi:MAG: hypothetical protein CME26_03310 [Gemmatimonadetes bacterium]|nr:hypothetical protein [Gemmatimonadota bacterium]